MEKKKKEKKKSRVIHVLREANQATDYKANSALSGDADGYINGGL